MWRVTQIWPPSWNEICENISAVGKDEMTNDLNDLHWPVTSRIRGQEILKVNFWLLLKYIFTNLLIKSLGHTNIPRWYAMAMWSMRRQKLIDQLSCKISEIMRKKTIKNVDWRPLWILFVWNLSWIIIWVRPYILFYIHGPATSHFFLSCANITKLLNFKLAAKRPVLSCVL